MPRRTTSLPAIPTLYKGVDIIPKRTTQGVRPADHRGLTYGLLAVQEFVGWSSHVTPEPQWSCLCSCGNTKTTTTRQLTRGHTTSCGCISRRGLLPGGNNRKDYGEARFNDLFRQYMRSATARGHVFELSRDDFRRLTKGYCRYCGKEPSQVIHARHGVNGEYTYNGIDRIDNSTGYVTGNVCSCCKVCNTAKSTLGEAEFLLWVIRVYERFAR